VVDIYVHYEGELRCVARHGPSASQLTTDAPVDNHGRGEGFSPTDLVATALGTCMLTVMGIQARKQGWDIAGIDMHVKKQMSAELPRKIVRLSVTATVPPAVSAKLDAAARAALEHTANTCPVRLSVHEQIDVPVAFAW
jgi:putative redox protein